MVPHLSCAAVAAGADALLIEVHPCPATPWCDADQALSVPEFGTLMQRLGAVAQANGRTLSMPQGRGRKRTGPCRVTPATAPLVGPPYNLHPFACPDRDATNMELAKSSSPTRSSEVYPLWKRVDISSRSYAPGAALLHALPPPNVTGTPANGHAFQQTPDGRADPLSRSRLQHAVQVGQTTRIATQIVSSKQLGDRRWTPRSRPQKFVERVWQWKEELGDDHEPDRRLRRRRGLTRERFTMDEGL